jgi:hypothetical protein
MKIMKNLKEKYLIINPKKENTHGKMGKYFLEIYLKIIDL